MQKNQRTRLRRQSPKSDGRRRSEWRRPQSAAPHSFPKSAVWRKVEGKEGSFEPSIPASVSMRYPPRLRFDPAPSSMERHLLDGLRETLAIENIWNLADFLRSCFCRWPFFGSGRPSSLHRHRRKSQLLPQSRKPILSRKLRKLQKSERPRLKARNHWPSRIILLK